MVVEFPDKEGEKFDVVRSNLRLAAKEGTYIRKGIYRYTIIKYIEDGVNVVITREDGKKLTAIELALCVRTHGEVDRKGVSPYVCMSVSFYQHA